MSNAATAAARYQRVTPRSGGSSSISHPTGARAGSVAGPMAAPSPLIALCTTAPCASDASRVPSDLTETGASEKTLELRVDIR